jgi:hypothetical protein
MSRVSAFLMGIVNACVVVSPLRAEHAKINLEVSAPTGQVSASVDQTPPAWGKNPRPVLNAKVGDPIRINFLLTNVYPHKTLENVVVHFYIAPERKAGQHDLPDLSQDVFTETAFEMDFKPGGKAGQRSTIRIDKPGVYLVRVETRNTHSDHEHFAAIDLVVAAEAAP